MSKQYRGRRNNNRGGGGNNRSDNRRNEKPVVDPSDSVQMMFVGLSKQLDARHDRRERIVKISRDVTIESKRIIFNLHRIKCDEDKPTILGEVERRLSDLKYGPLYRLGKELEGEEHHQFIRAYTGGLQEWVEALSFYHFLAYGSIIEHQQAQKELMWIPRTDINNVKEEVKQENVKGEDDTMGHDTESEISNLETQDSNAVKENEADDEGTTGKNLNINQEESIKDVSKVKNECEPDKDAKPILMVTIPESEFILGLADLTGELMRNAINSLGSGDTQVCFSLLALLQSFAEGFNRLDWRECPRDTGMKVRVLKQSLVKVENACYAISVRGSEIPKNHLADIFSQVELRAAETGKHEAESDMQFFDD